MTQIARCTLKPDDIARVQDCLFYIIIIDVWRAKRENGFLGFSVASTANTHHVDDARIVLQVKI